MNQEGKGHELDISSFRVPSEFQGVLENWLREVLRFQPEKIIEFSRDYFTHLDAGTVDQFLSQKSTDHHNKLKTLQDYAFPGQSQAGLGKSQKRPEDMDETEKEILNMGGGRLKENQNSAPGLYSPRNDETDEAEMLQLQAQLERQEKAQGR